MKNTDRLDGFKITAKRVAGHVPKCPRCYRYEQAATLNFEGLCDRCCDIVVKEFPDHWSVPRIKAALAKQKAMTPADWRAHNHKLDPVQWPNP